jgi:thiol-disulfide isomerase/thioredoxin
MTLDVEILNRNSIQTPLYLEVFGYVGENGEELLLKKIVLKRNKDRVIVPLKYVMRGRFEIWVNDSLVAASNVVYLSEEKLSLVCNIPGLIKVKSIQNQFKQLNENLLFAVPALIKNSKDFSVDKVKNKYKSEYTGNYYLQKYVAEYEASVVRQVKAYRNYYHCLFSLCQNRMYLSPETLDTCLSILSNFKGRTHDYDELSKYNEACKRTMIGQPFPSFAFNTLEAVNKKPLEKNNSNKYILYDFGASWCVPCREQNITISKYFNQIDTSRFQIVLISLDKKKEDWLNALKTDAINWPSYIDTTGQRGNTYKIFGLVYIPQNLLVDKEGGIIQKNLNAEGLYEFLKEKGFIY